MNEDGSVAAQMRSERRGRPGGEAKAYDVKIAQLSKCLRDDSPPLPSPSAPLQRRRSHRAKQLATVLNGTGDNNVFIFIPTPPPSPSLLPPPPRDDFPAHAPPSSASRPAPHKRRGDRFEV